MADYPGTPDVALNSVDLTNAAYFEVGTSDKITVTANYDASGWGQTVLLHLLPVGTEKTLNPAVNSLNNTRASEIMLDGTAGASGAYMISVWVFWGGNAQGNNPINRWTQVPKVGETPSFPAGGIARFVGGQFPMQAPGPAGSVSVTYSRA